MSTCRDCDQPIQWIGGKPYDIAPSLHYRSCTARRKPKAKPSRKETPAVAFSANGATDAEQAALLRLLEQSCADGAKEAQ